MKQSQLDRWRSFSWLLLAGCGAAVCTDREVASHGATEVELQRLVHLLPHWSHDRRPLRLQIAHSGATSLRALTGKEQHSANSGGMERSRFD